MANHARLSPSSAVRWLNCKAAPVMESGKPNTTSEHAAEGTAAHYLAEQCLINDLTADRFTDDRLAVTKAGRVIKWTPDLGDVNPEADFDFDVDGDMADHVQEYLDTVRAVRDSMGGELLVEQRLNLEPITGEKGAKGTADAVILGDDEIAVIDLKFGMGVQVEAENNPQLMLYGLAALIEYEYAGDFKTVRLVISQPRRRHSSEWTIEADELREFGRQVSKTADLIRSLNDKSDLSGLFAPGEKTCKWCKAAATCTAYAEYVHKTVMDEFISLDSPLTVSDATMDSDTLAEMFERTEAVKNWVKAIEAETHNRLMAGEKVGEFKLVQGRRGARKWADEAAVESALKALKLKSDEMYKQKLASPTDVEKLVKKDRLTTEEWDRLQTLITAPEGKPTVAPYHDKREAINPADIFGDI